jgi:hypothetical protein
MSAQKLSLLLSIAQGRAHMHIQQAVFRILLLFVGVFFVLPALSGNSNSRVVDNYDFLTGNLHDKLTFPFEVVTPVSGHKSGRLVFAHYFTQFPISHDNLDAKHDYYTKHYLSPYGEQGKFQSSGGFIRQRPIPRPRYQEPGWAVRDIRNEIARASKIGIDGFACDVLASSGPHWEAAKRLLDASNDFGKEFKILLMPDMEAEFKTSPLNIERVIRYWWTHPAAMRAANGNLIVAPYNAQTKSAEWWGRLKKRLDAEGIRIQLFPVFQGWQKYAAEYSAVSMGFSDWGVRSPSANKKLSLMPMLAKSYGVRWMAPVAPQDVRPKDLMFWEALNSENYRVMWEGAIKGGADWVHLITWNDYSESTEISPSTGTRNVFYDLTAYYISWYKHGTPPAITKDGIYYLYRGHSVHAMPDPKAQSRPYRTFRQSDEPADDIEVIVFLTAPATVRVVLGRQEFSREFGKGFFSYRVPISEGRPSFSIVRDGVVLLEIEGNVAISNRIIYQDLIYRGGGVVRIGVN